MSAEKVLFNRKAKVEELDAKIADLVSERNAAQAEVDALTKDDK